MGRQVEVAMLDDDEIAFQSFLEGIANIAIYRARSPKPTAIGAFGTVPDEWTFYVHNRSFSWEPTFDEMRYVDSAGDPQVFYRPNDRHAPLLEYSRHSFQAPNPQVAGRLYWAKLFVSQPSELQYDVVAFDRWFSAVARWVRRNGIRMNHGSTEPWCLPRAAAALRALPNPSFQRTAARPLN